MGCGWLRLNPYKCIFSLYVCLFFHGGFSWFPYLKLDSFNMRWGFSSFIWEKFYLLWHWPDLDRLGSWWKEPFHLWWWLFFLWLFPCGVSSQGGLATFGWRYAWCPKVLLLFRELKNLLDFFIYLWDFVNTFYWFLAPYLSLQGWAVSSFEAFSFGVVLLLLQLLGPYWRLL